MAKKLDAMDRYFAEDNPENPTVQLPDDNEKKGEDNGQGSEAAGALSENDNPQGLSTVKPGEDEITGTESTEYDDVYDFIKNEKEDDDGAGEGGNGDDGDKGDDGDNGSGDDGDGEGKKGDDGEGTGDGEGKNCGGKGGKGRKPRKNEDTPDNPKTDLPSDNEKKGEDNGQGSEAAGALSEDDDPNGLTTVKPGEDEISGTGSTEYDNAWNYFDTDGEDGDGDGEGKGGDDGDGQKGDDDGEGSGDGEGAGDDDGKKGGEGEGTGDGEGKNCNGKGGKGKGKGKPRKNEDGDDKGSDDDGASKKDPVTGPDDGDGKKGDDDGGKGDDDGKKGDDDDDAPVDDFFRVADEDEFEKPENLPGTTEAPTPVDGEGNKVDPNGNPDLPSNLTEQPLETVATPPGSTEPLANSMSRYFFG